MSADDLAELRKQHRVFARLVRAVHADELAEGIGELVSVIRAFERLRRGELQSLIGYPAACLMLREKYIHQVHELSRFFKARENEVFFQLLVVILDEIANDLRGIRYRIR